MLIYTISLYWRYAYVERVFLNTTVLLTKEISKDREGSNTKSSKSSSSWDVPANTMKQIFNILYTEDRERKDGQYW